MRAGRNRLRQALDAYRDVVRSPSYSLLWLGQILSSFGDTLHYIVLVVLVFQMTGAGSRSRGSQPPAVAGLWPGSSGARLSRRGAYGKQIGLRHSIPEVIFKGDFDTPRFAFELAPKDIGLATELAREYNVPMPMSNVAEQNMIEGMNRGWGRRDTSATFQLQEERAGVQVRTSS